MQRVSVTLLSFNPLATHPANSCDLVCDRRIRIAMVRVTQFTAVECRQRKYARLYLYWIWHILREWGKKSKSYKDWIFPLINRIVLKRLSELHSITHWLVCEISYHCMCFFLTHARCDACSIKTFFSLSLYHNLIDRQLVATDLPQDSQVRWFSRWNSHKVNQQKDRVQILLELHVHNFEQRFLILASNDGEARGEHIESNIEEL